MNAFLWQLATDIFSFLVVILLSFQLLRGYFSFNPLVKFQFIGERERKKCGLSGARDSNRIVNIWVCVDVRSVLPRVDTKIDRKKLFRLKHERDDGKIRSDKLLQ